MTCKDYSDQKIEDIKEQLEKLKREYRAYVNGIIGQQYMLYSCNLAI